MRSLPLPEYLEHHVISGDPLQQAHARDVLALMDIEQELEVFAERCVAVPLVKDNGQWRLAPGTDPDPILALVTHDQALAQIPETTSAEKRLAQLVQEAGTMLGSTQPLFPLMMVADARWLLFYQQDVFSAYENASLSLGVAYTGGNPMDTLALLASNGDPIAWFYDRLKSRQTRVDAQAAHELDEGCTPEFVH